MSRRGYVRGRPQICGTATPPRDYGGIEDQQQCVGCPATGLVDPVALMSNYAATAARLIAFDMRLDPDQKSPLFTAMSTEDYRPMRRANHTDAARDF
jgi:hypothetical protein